MAIQKSHRHNRFTKGHQRNFHQLEMLAGERNADDGNEQNQPEYNMRNGDTNAGEKKPENVEQQGEATAAPLRAHRHAAKRPQHKSRQLKTLQAEGDADNGQAQYQPTEQVTER